MSKRPAPSGRPKWALRERWVDRTEERFGLKPGFLVADTAFGWADNLAWLVKQKWITRYIPVFDKSTHRRHVLGFGLHVRSRGRLPRRAPASGLTERVVTARARRIVTSFAAAQSPAVIALVIRCSRPRGSDLLPPQWTASHELGAARDFVQIHVETAQQSSGGTDPPSLSVVHVTQVEPRALLCP
jgi:hypothetical protein